MRTAYRLGMLACLSSLAWHHGLAAEMPRPQHGVVADGVYANTYFDLSYPLPAGWTQDVSGPAPSVYGYYVLAGFVPAGEPTGAILIAAQDLFFAAAMPEDAAGAARELAASMAKVAGMTIDRPPTQVAIGRRAFSRVDFSGVGLFRSTYFTHSRCHLVSFNLTANSAERLAALVLTLERLGGVRDGMVETPEPPCRGGHAAAENVLSKVDPAPSGPTYTPIPVRIVVGAEGAVKDVHVIRATVEQRRGIETALAQWRFKPRATEIETGLLIEFRPGGVAYPDGDRR
jgi:hypothetical protein